MADPRLSFTAPAAMAASSSSQQQQQQQQQPPPPLSSHGPGAVAAAEDNFDFLFKIVLIGDCGTGKTCVVQRFKNGTYAENQGNTIGVDFSMKTVKIDGKKVKVSAAPLSFPMTMIIICARRIIVADMGYGRSREVSHNHAELLPVGQRSPIG